MVKAQEPEKPSPVKKPSIPKNTRGKPRKMPAPPKVDPNKK